MSGEMDRYFHSRRALKKRVAEQNAEITTLRGQIRDLQRTVAFFASVIKSGEGWTEQCDRAWPVTLEPCVHDFHRTEHGVMPCTKCGADAPPSAAHAGTMKEEP